MCWSVGGDGGRGMRGGVGKCVGFRVGNRYSKK